jgi:hypothetical protein
VTTGSEGLHLAMERPAPGGTGRPAGTGAPAGPPSSTPGEAPGAAAADGPAVPTYDDLARSIGGTVTLLPDGPELEIVAVDARPRPGHSGPVPYSTLLAGPPDRPVPQGVHRLDMPGTGPVEMFVVPLEPADGRAVYEIISN